MCSKTATAIVFLGFCQLNTPLAQIQKEKFLAPKTANFNFNKILWTVIALTNLTSKTVYCTKENVSYYMACKVPLPVKDPSIKGLSDYNQRIINLADLVEVQKTFQEPNFESKVTTEISFLATLIGRYFYSIRFLNLDHFSDFRQHYGQDYAVDGTAVNNYLNEAFSRKEIPKSDIEGILDRTAHLHFPYTVTYIKEYILPGLLPDTPYYDRHRIVNGHILGLLYNEYVNGIKYVKESQKESYKKIMTLCQISLYGRGLTDLELEYCIKSKQTVIHVHVEKKGQKSPLECRYYKVRTYYCDELPPTNPVIKYLSEKIKTSTNKFIKAPEPTLIWLGRYRAPKAESTNSPSKVVAKK